MMRFGTTCRDLGYISNSPIYIYIYIDYIVENMEFENLFAHRGESNGRAYGTYSSSSGRLSVERSVCGMSTRRMEEVGRGLSPRIHDKKSDAP